MSPLAVQAYLFIVAAGWKCYQLARSRFEFPIIAVTAALLAQVVGQSVPTLVGEDVLNSLLGERWVRFLMGAVIGAGLLATSLFFQSSARAGTLTSRRLGVELAIAVAVALAALITTALQPAVLAGRGGDSATSSVADFSPGRIEHLYPLFLIVNLYYLWATGTAARFALAASSQARSYLRAGLVLTGLSLALLFVAVALRLFAGAVILAGYSSAIDGVRIAGTGIFIALVCLALGVSIPAAGVRARASLIWVRRRRMFRRLDGLAGELHDLFPELTLRTIPVYSVLERAGLRHVARNFYRRVIEIHDALMQLSRYLDAGQVVASSDPAAQARLVTAALRARHEDRAASEYAVDLGIAGTSQSLDADGHALVDLAQALRRTSGWFTPAAAG